MRDNNINCTIHAGEAYGPESIAQAIHVCGAHRIGHGCRLREDGDLLHYLNDHRVPLECCPSSNVQTGAVRDLASHPIKLYFDLGLRVTVNTDNRLITDTSVSKELYLVHTQMGVPFTDIKSMIVAGFKSSFQPFHEKQAALRRVGVELDKYDDNGALRSVSSPLQASALRAGRAAAPSSSPTPSDFAARARSNRDAEGCAPNDGARDHQTKSVRNARPRARRRPSRIPASLRLPQARPTWWRAA